MLSTITQGVAPLEADAELARLLASAASCGWTPNSTADVSCRADWPGWLTDRIEALPGHGRRSLVDSARSLHRAFAGEPDAVAQIVGRLTVLIRHGRPVFVCRSEARRLAVVAALGLADVVEHNGPGAVALCASITCDQPVLTQRRPRPSPYCSRECANRTRVRRHRLHQASPTGHVHRTEPPEQPNGP